MQLYLPTHRYECTGCGRCCRANWTVAVDPTSQASIRASQAYESKVRAGYTPLVLVSERVNLARGEDGSCLFLDSRQACEIHAELGPSAKPMVCQTYPYLFTLTPDGVYAALSYACPAVSSQSGPEIENQRAALETLLRERGEDFPYTARVGNLVEIRQGEWLDWPDYLRLEEQISTLFCADDPVSSLLGIAVVLILPPNSIGGRYPLSAEAKVEASEEAEARQGVRDLGGFERELLAMVSCNLIAVTDQATDPGERARLGSLLWNGGRHVCKRLGVELSGFSLQKPDNPEMQAMLDTYVRQSIHGKRMLAGGTVVSRILKLACGLSILMFYDRALRQAENSDGFSWEAVDRAFTLVESELLSHTHSFDGFFLEFEQGLRSIRDSLYPRG